MPLALQNETLHSFYWLSISIPIVIATAGLRGVLEAMQQFRLATAIRIPMGIFTYLGPVLVLPFSHNLVPIIVVLVVGRTVACVAYFWACARTLPGIWKTRSFHVSFIRPLLSFGSWMTVSNILGPLMVTFDRFVIGAMISLTAVAYYATPYEVVTKLWLIPAALMGVLFPAFATADAANRDRLAFLFECGVKYIFIGLFPIALALITFAPGALTIWLGKDFAQNSASVVRWLAVGVFFNSLANVPFCLLQSIGRADLTAKLHICELPIYVIALFSMVRVWGIEGAAIAWFVRVSIDAALLFYISRRSLPHDNFITSKFPIMLGAAAISFVLAITNASPISRVLEFGGICIFATAAAWLWLLSPYEKALLRYRLKRDSSASAVG